MINFCGLLKNSFFGSLPIIKLYVSLYLMIQLRIAGRYIAHYVKLSQPKSMWGNLF